MSKLKPFENESQTATVGEMTIENRLDRVSFFGSLDITYTREGLSNALELKSFLDPVVEALKKAAASEQGLPDSLVLEAAVTVKNPLL